MASWNPAEYGEKEDRVEKTVFLAGTGAEENAWPPVTEAIEAVFPSARKAPKDVAWENFIMAKLVAVHRAQAASLKLNPDGGEGNGQEVLDRLRQEIARCLRDAVTNGKLFLRPKFLEVAQNPEWGSRSILTTNWDTSIKESLPTVPVRHIHGSVSDHAPIYLPSDYAFDPSHSEHTMRNMFLAQHECIETLWDATIVVLYGLSLDPLDGELAAICATGFQARVPGEENLRRIVIYDLPDKKETLTNRVRWLHPNPDSIEIEFRPVL